MKTKEDKISRIEVIGRFLTQDITGKKLVVLSEECTAYIMNLSDNSKQSYNYALNNLNQEKGENSSWNFLSFEIKPSMKLSQFTNKDVDIFQWVTKTNIYFLEILVDDINERNINNFRKILEQCLYSVNKNIPLNRAGIQTNRSSKKYLKNLGEINDIQNHVDYLLKNLEEQKKKEEIEKELIKNMKELKITIPKVDSIINTQVAKKIFEAEGQLYNYDEAKNELINLNNENQTMILRI